MSQSNGRVERAARLRWIPIAQMKVSPLAQRDFKQPRADKMAANFNLEQLGTPTVSKREEWYYIVDGQHRIAALEAIDFGDLDVQCWVYEGLTEQAEAEMFLLLNDQLAVNAFSKFRIGVHAGRADECDIDRVVRGVGLRVSQDKGNGAISAVGTLRKVYEKAGAATLGRTLRIVRDAYGDPGLEATVIGGLGLLCQRYNGTLDDERLVTRLSNAHGGVNGLLGRAETLRRQTGNQLSHCVAAAAVEIHNSGRGGTKMPSWWSQS